MEMKDSPLGILARISTLLGFAYTRCDIKTVLKIRQSMDIFLDNLLKEISPQAINKLVMDEMRKKMKYD